MRTILNRTYYNEWLGKGLKMSSRLFLYGFKGAGKTTLTRQWLQTQKHDFKWYTMSNRSTLQSVLGVAETTPIESLLSDENFFKNSITVWDDFHLLSLSLRQQILDALAYHNHRSHIFLSDEKIENYPEIPQLIVNGFSKDELIAYLKELDIKVALDEIENLIQKTGGLPLLINLWVQSPEKQDKSFILSNSLDSNLKDLLILLSFINAPVAETQLGEQLSYAQELTNKLLLESSQGVLSVPPVIRATLLERLSAKEQQEWSFKALQWLHSTNSHKQLQSWQLLSLSLKSADSESILQHSQNLDYAQLEQMAMVSLRELLQDLEAVLSRIQNSELKRLKIHLLSLTGQRDSAVEFANSLITSRTDYDIIETQWLLLDAIHCLHRAGISNTTSEALSQLVNRSQNPLKLYFKLEQALPFVYTDPNRAQESLLRLFKDISSPKDNSTKQIFAQVSFQLGVVFNQIQDFTQALHYFNLSQATYSELGRFYHSAFCQFNKTWIYFHLQDHDKFQKNFDELQKLVAKWGYRLLHVGLNWLAAENCFINLQPQSAFHYIQEAEKLAAHNMPFKTKLDLFISKCRILKELGNNSEALQVFQKNKNQFKESHDNRLNLLEIELKSQDLSIDEIYEAWTKLGGQESDEILFCLLVEKGGTPPPLQQPPNRRTQCFLLISNIFSQKSQTDQLQPLLKTLVSTLENTQALSVQLAALLCLQSLAPSDSQEKQILSLLENSLITQESRSVFKFWKEQIDNKQEPLKNWPSHFSDIEHLKWQKWMQLIATQNASYRMYTQQGFQDLAHLPPQFANDGIVLVEDRGLVYLKKKKITDFYRKPVLRQILALLMEVYPGSLSKSNLAFALWGEEYNPQIHDARVYTSIQRLRTLLKSDVIETWQDGYRWKQEIPFYYFRSLVQQDLGNHRIKTLILETLKKAAANQNTCLSRAALVEATGSSDATVKRVLSKLIEEGLISRSGRGPQVSYSINTKTANKP